VCLLLSVIYNYYIINQSIIYYYISVLSGIQSTLSLNASELRGEVEVGDDINTKRDEEQISLCLQSCDK